MEKELIEDVIEKVIILRCTDGTTRYALHLINDKRAVVTVGQLLSLRSCMGLITNAAGRLYRFPDDQESWLDVVRRLLDDAQEERVMPTSKFSAVAQVLSEYLAGWNGTGDAEKFDVFARINDSCVVELGIMFFRLANLKTKLRAHDTGFNTALLCSVLRRLGAVPTEPRKKFAGRRIRTWEIPVSTIKPQKSPINT